MHQRQGGVSPGSTNELIALANASGGVKSIVDPFKRAIESKHLSINFNEPLRYQESSGTLTDHE